MQELKQKISPIKQRILQYIESTGISKREFYAKTGISRGTLESNTGITEEIMAKFLAHYGEISIDWLINGIGEPIIEDIKFSKTQSFDTMSENLESLFLKIISEKDRELQRQAEEIGSLKEQLRTLKKSTGYQSSNIAAE